MIHVPDTRFGYPPAMSGAAAAWFALFVAGALEIVWAYGLKQADGFTRFWPSVGTVAAIGLSFAFMAVALKSIPFGTAYAVWCGIGVAGTVIVGIVAFGEPTTATRLLCVALIATGHHRAETGGNRVISDRHGSAKQITDKLRMNVAPLLPPELENEGSVRVRTLFLSDIHLGTRGCQAERLVEFLRDYDADTIFLVGDIVDGWALKSTWYWPQAHNDVVQKLLRKARKGARIIYIPGNHDEFLRDYYGSHFGGIEVVEDAMHVTADGRSYLVIHGDLFDVVIKHARWLALLGDKAYDFAIWLNTHFNAIRRALGFTYWSLSRWAKLKVKNAVNFIGAFELALANEARRRGAEGVICGHIHHPIVRPLEGLVYVNCGDWVESCTAVVEHFDGRLEIIDWTEAQSKIDVVQAEVRGPARALPVS